VNISAGYQRTERIEVEGQASAMGDSKLGPYDLKYLFYGGGAILSAGGGRARPFVRGLMGFVHVSPQTAYSDHSFAGLAGPATEIRLNRLLAMRIGADYIRSIDIAVRRTMSGSMLSCTIDFYRSENPQLARHSRARAA
jgi:hypothetical protein